MIVLILNLVLSAAVLSAAGTEHVRVKLSTVTGTVGAYRYQINGTDSDKWEVAFANDPYAEWDTSAIEKDHIFIETTVNTKDWSAPYEFTYDSSSDEWKPVTLTLTSAEKESDTKISAGALYSMPLSGFPDAMYEQAYGGVLRYSKGLGRQTLSGEVLYSYGEGSSGAITTIQEISLGVIAGYPVSLGVLSLASELGGGVIAHFVEHSTMGVQNFYDAYGKAGVTLSGALGENREIYLRGEAGVYSGSTDVVVQTNISAGIQVGL